MGKVHAVIVNAVSLFDYGVKNKKYYAKLFWLAPDAEDRVLPKLLGTTHVAGGESCNPQWDNEFVEFYIPQSIPATQGAGKFKAQLFYKAGFKEICIGMIEIKRSRLPPFFPEDYQLHKVITAGKDQATKVPIQGALGLNIQIEGHKKPTRRQRIMLEDAGTSVWAAQRAGKLWKELAMDHSGEGGSARNLASTFLQQALAANAQSGGEDELDEAAEEDVEVEKAGKKGKKEKKKRRWMSMKKKTKKPAAVPVVRPGAGVPIVRPNDDDEGEDTEEDTEEETDEEEEPLTDDDFDETDEDEPDADA